MTYQETGFRALYHHFCAFPLIEELKQPLEGFPEAARGNYVMVYGYVDPDEGLKLEIIAAALRTDDGFRVAETAPEIRASVSVDAVGEAEFYYFGDEDGKLADRYAAKLDALKEYAVSEQIEQSRMMGFLDASRDGKNIDTIGVFLVRDGLQAEQCRAKILGLGENYIVAELVDEPVQDFDYHKGEQIVFSAQKTDDGVICFSNLNPNKWMSEEELEDGKLLEEAVAAFCEEQNDEHFTEVLELLRDSYVWIPCNAVMSSADQERWEAVMKDIQENPQAHQQDEAFEMNDDMWMVPAILENEGNPYFPIFSNMAAMGDFGDNYSKVQKHILEVIPLARENQVELKGIVLNPFTQAFALEPRLWDIIEHLKSRIKKTAVEVAELPC